MGANTYREMSQIVAEGDDPTFERMAEIPKVVFSSTLKPPLTWANTEIADDAVTTLRPMKEGSAPMRTMGSISLNATLVREGLVDLLQIVVFPVVTGVSGKKPIYAGWPDLDLELVTSRTFDGRMQLLQYVPRCTDRERGLGHRCRPRSRWLPLVGSGRTQAPSSRPWSVATGSSTGAPERRREGAPLP